MSIRYGDSLVVDSALSQQHLAPKLPVGERFFSAQVVNQASATADQLTTRIPFTGAWRILVFAGDVAQPAVMERLRRLNAYLDGPESVVSKYTPPDRKRWDVVDVITVRACLSLLHRRNYPKSLTGRLLRLRRAHVARALRLSATFHLSPAQLRSDLCRRTFA